jgi:hypothetical protein
MARLVVPAELEAVFHNFRTAEFSTIAKDGTPVTWPVTLVYQPEQGTFLTATSIGQPNKAFNIRRNPRVSLLYSEPKASGLTTPPAVLVQGDAQVSDGITLIEGLESYWAKITKFQPASRGFTKNAIGRMLMNWYYIRLKITITPRRILWWPKGDFSQPPQELDLNIAEALAELEVDYVG